MATTALALGVGLGLTASGPAAAADPQPPAYSTGWIALSTGTTNKVTTSLSGYTQTLTSDQSCAMQGYEGPLLSFDASGDYGVGLNSGAIGVRESATSNGTSCSAVNSPSEYLEVGLSSRLQNAGYVAFSASLDIDLKQNTNITATPLLDGTPTGQTFELQSGTNISGDPGPTVRQCEANSADSGPDAKTGNNCRWVINTVFDSLKLEATAGSFSLMGGADGPVPGLPDYLPSDITEQGASVIELADSDKIVECGDTAFLESSPAILDPTWERLGTKCAPYPYASAATTTDDQGDVRPTVYFKKPFAGLSSSSAGDQALWTTTFTYSGKRPTLQFQFDLPNGDTTDWAPLPLCADDNVKKDDGSNSYSGFEVDEYGNYACVDSSAFGGSGNVKTATFTVLVVGDAGMRF